MFQQSSKPAATRANILQSLLSCDSCRNLQEAESVVTLVESSHPRKHSAIVNFLLLCDCYGGLKALQHVESGRPPHKHSAMLISYGQCGTLREA